jgi:hypothetical protein
MFFETLLRTFADGDRAEAVGGFGGFRHGFVWKAPAPLPILPLPL